MLNNIQMDTAQLEKLLQAQGFNSMQDFLKAAEVITTNTFSPEDRSIFSPENLEEDVKLTVPKATPLRNRIPRVRGYGEATAWKRLTSKLHSRSGGVAGVGTNTSITFADAGAPNETTQSFTVRSEAYKLLGRKLEVGGLAIAASRGMQGGNHFEQRLRHKITEVMLGEEELIIGGNSGNVSTEFDGLSVQITTNSGTRSLLTVSGVNNDIANTLYKEGSSPTMLVANARNIQALSDELQGAGSIQRIVVDSQGNAIGGLRVAKMVNAVDGTLIDLITSRYVANQGYLLTEVDESGLVHIDISELIPMSRVDVPSSNFSSIAFIVEAEALRVKAEPYQFKYTGLATS
jgi:hypothetical protein